MSQIEATLNKLQRLTFEYFLKESNRANGMVPDNTRKTRMPALLR